MNRAKLKSYAPQARTDFIQAMTDRAAFYGLTAGKIESVVDSGDVAVIAGREFPRSIVGKRKRLADRIQANGFDQTMEAMAYTWFNRLVAIRFMELHGYLDHGYRVLSPSPHRGESRGEGLIPEILEHAEHVDLPGLKKDLVVDLKLAGNKEAELYRLLLTAQCNALNTAMPFLFEKIDDETELLLPDNLLNSDSLIRKLVSEIDEADWQEVEIIGWLYQFYISEKKDKVIGRVVASEDIPAATQLFTPNWIVKYLVQNTLGRLWLEHHPESPLKAKMEYYIEPAEQTAEVAEQLREIVRQRAAEHHGRDGGHGNARKDTETEGGNTTARTSAPSQSTSVFLPSPSVAVDLSLNPELLTLLDPACGSGHILVEAYELFKAIYQERGYRAKDIPRLILEKNLFGLEIDDRAAQLASFALMMKARADDRRIFDSGAQPNILAFQESRGMDAAAITHALNSPIVREKRPRQYLFEEIEEEKAGLFSKKALAEPGHISQADIAALIDLFKNAKTFGSLIRVPEPLAAKLPEIEQRLNDVVKHGDLTHMSAQVLNPLLVQTSLLTMQYDAVAANPPYMGGKYFAERLKKFVLGFYPNAKADLYACFMQRNRQFATGSGFHGMINIPNWMFLSSFEDLRKSLLQEQTIDTFIHNGRGVFGSDFGSCAFVIRTSHLPQYRGSFRRLFEKQGSVANNEELEARFRSAKTFTPSNADFSKVPGSPVAYWVSPSFFQCFTRFDSINNYADGRVGLQTSDNGRFLRSWTEVAIDTTNLRTRNSLYTGQKWVAYNKGGVFRKWFGNLEYVVNWAGCGAEIKACEPKAVVRNPQYHFREGITWSDVTIAKTAARLLPTGCISDSAGHSAYFKDEGDRLHTLAFINTPVCDSIISVINPTVHFHIGYFNLLPFWRDGRVLTHNTVNEAIDLACYDWNLSETSWDFQSLPVLERRDPSLREAREVAAADSLKRFARMQELEEENNRRFIEAYGLQDELSPEVPDDQITLYRPDRTEDIKRLISYAIGCMMGRYSLDKPGLVYAHAGNRDFDQIYFSPPNQPPQPAQTAPPNSAPVPFPCPSVPSVAPFPSDPPQRDLPPDSSHGNARKDTEKVTTQTSAARTQVQPNPSPFPCPSVSSVAPFPSDPSERNLAPDGSHGNARKDTENVETPTPAASTQFQPNSSPFPCPSVSSVAPFLPDQDGIIPLLETDWGFRDDAASRFEEFIGVAWPTTGDTEGHGKVLLEENLKFVADSLGPTGGEQPRETIRRYLATGFYKHHLSMYKRRPIYWLFSSGKQRAFQCLVYLHRYHDGTLARMRTQFVIPLQGQIAARIEQLEGDKAKATSTSHRKKLQKEQDDLKKQQAELLTFEEKLKHYADMRISLDLDDGVKVNYGKFGDLLAEVKAVTGGKDEE